MRSQISGPEWNIFSQMLNVLHTFLPPVLGLAESYDPGKPSSTVPVSLKV